MAPAHICVVKNHISPQVATDNCKRLVKQPQSTLCCILVFNSELKRILNSTGS